MSTDAVIGVIRVHKNLADRSFSILSAIDLLRTLDVKLGLGERRCLEGPENLYWRGINNLDRRSYPGILERSGI